MFRADLAHLPDLGMIIPNMGTKRRDPAGLADVLFTPVQGRVLGLLFGQPKRRFQSGELIRLAGSGTGAAHRMLTRLADAGLVTVMQTGNQKHYQANRASPVFAELHALVLKTVGLVEPLQQALAPRAGDIRAAFVYGSVAKRTETANSDVDLMIVSDRLSHAEAFEILEPVERVLARRVTPTVMTRGEWHAARAEPDAFAARVAEGRRVWLIGSDDDLA